jgi:hypothetical protein
MTAIAPTPTSTTTTTAHTPISRRSQIAGRIVTGVIAALLLVDAVSHILMPEGVKDASYELGFTDGDILAMGLVLLGCLALYLFPRTAILGAVLLTGYFGGAVTALMIAEESFAAGVVMPIIAGIAVWAGLWLRNTTVRSIMPLNRH